MGKIRPILRPECVFRCDWYIARENVAVWSSFVLVHYGDIFLGSGKHKRSEVEGARLQSRDLMNGYRASHNTQ